MSDAGTNELLENKMKAAEEEEDSADEVWESEDDDETIARIQRAHYAQAAAMTARKRAAPRPRAMSHKRKMEAVKNFHDFTKKLKKDTGITIHSLVGNNILDLSDYSSDDNKSDSDGLSEEEFVVNLNAVHELNEENESYIDPETGDFVDAKRNTNTTNQCDNVTNSAIKEEETQEGTEQPKTLSISDIINDGDLDLTKNVEIAEVEESELCPEKTVEDLLEGKEENSQDFDIREKLKEMGEISVKPVNKSEEDPLPRDDDKKPDVEDDKKALNLNALNVRRNIREVMDEKNLDASTLAAQRQESERLARVQEQQRIIREVQRQIALNRQNKIHQKTLSLLQGGSSLLKKTASGQKLNLPNTVLVKLPSGEMKRTTLKQGQVEVTKMLKPTASSSATMQKIMRPDQKSERKEVVEIVDSSSGEETSSSSSDSDDCIMLSDSEVPPSPEAEDDPSNSGLHVNDAYNIPDEQGRVQINIGHPENEEDIFLAPQIARIIKPHQVGGVRFLFDNIIESVERFSTSTGFGCILAHSMGLGKTLQIVCFCDIFLRHTTSKTVLCIMPINTLQNWVAEFNMWLPLDPSRSPLAAHGEVRARNFPIYVLNDSHKTLQMRAKVVKDWSTSGGVLMIGYELYRLLSMKKDKKPRKKRKADVKAEEKKSDKPDVANEDTQGSDNTMQSKLSDETRTEDGDMSKIDGDIKDEAIKEEKKEDVPTDEEKKLLDEMYEALVRPGPDLVICDEGHRIKNSHSNISYALKQMRTKRRIVLTGYPLQNNLLEYWCMVDFVRPNYLGSKTEFCNMFERPIQNGQCIDSTPQDIRLMRYRAHVLHSLLVGFVQRRSHAVLQSTLPQKEEYVLLVRMTPLQRKLYDRFMNEVVRSTSVPNPLKAFAICCKIWNHPDVLYNFLKKRSEANAAIEEDLDLEELRGATKAGRAKTTKATTRRAAKPRGTSKKPAATIPPNTTTGPANPRPDPAFSNNQYPPNGPFGPQSQPYRSDQPSGPYPPYTNYQNQEQGYYPPNPSNPPNPPNQSFNQNYGNNYYQQPPYNNYPNQYSQNNPPNQYPENVPPTQFSSNNPPTQYPQNESPAPFSQNNPPNQYNENNPTNQYPPSTGNQGYNQNYWGNGNYYGNTAYYNNPQFPNSQPPAEYNNSQQYPPNFNAPSDPNQPYQGNDAATYPQPNPSQENYGNQQRPPFPNYQNPPGYEYNQSQPTAPQYPNNQPPEGSYPSSYPPSYPGNSPYGQNPPPPYNQYDNGTQNYPNYPNNVTPTDQTHTNQQPVKSEPGVNANYQQNDIKSEPNTSQQTAMGYDNTGYNYNQPNTSAYSEQPEVGVNGNYPCQYPFSSHLETKPPLGSAGSGSPVTSWPITATLKTEVDKIKIEERTEIKSESDGEVKIEDLDTKKIVKDEMKKEHIFSETKNTPPQEKKNDKNELKLGKSDVSEPEDNVPKKGRQRGKKDNKKSEKPKPRGRPRAKARKDRKTSKEKTNVESESEESDKEEKLNREEELALMKKAEEMTYDWATELLKDYIPGIIENSSKMEIFFYILNESIKMGDRLLLFSQSLFTLNLIEDFLERNYIPGTNCHWQRNTNYYRLDGSTHALEREKLINEFNANPHVYLFLVSTRAGSLGINLVGANRVIVFDSSWNPCHDTQAVCRVYRYGQRKPCFVYRLVMDCCLEKKIYDRQINKQGMADRVVDECNPDAVLSMKEITNLCFDNDEKETEIKDLSEHKDKYIDVLMQGILVKHGKLLTKEPFQHESLLVDRKEKKLSSAEKRLAQRGYELEKKAALAPKPSLSYRTVRAADGSVVQRPVASVRPMQQHARWIPADVWRRQGMTAQEMTLPLDVVIPTNSAEKTNIVLKAGQRVMVLKSPKGIYMQLESGKIIAIKTSLKGLGQKAGESKDSHIGKKVLSRPSSANIPGSLKNNSAITITSKTPRPTYQRVIRPSMVGQNRIARPILPGQKIADIRNRLGDMRAAMRAKVPMQQGRMIRPGLSSSVSITKITKDDKKEEDKKEVDKIEQKTKLGIETEDDMQVIDSDEDITVRKSAQFADKGRENDTGSSENSKSENDVEKQTNFDNESQYNLKPLVLTTDEKLPSEEALEIRGVEELRNTPRESIKIDTNSVTENRKINLLKKYRHQRLGSRPQAESSLSQLERTASVLNKEGMPDFRRNLDDITQSYSPSGEEKPASRSRKKKSPTKVEVADSIDRQITPTPSMSHSVSSLLSGNTTKPRMVDQNMASINPMGGGSKPSQPITGMPHDPAQQSNMGSSKANVGLGSMIAVQSPNADVGQSPQPPMNALPPSAQYPGGGIPPDASYTQYPGYGMGYGGYPTAPYYGGYPPSYGYPYGPPGAHPAAPYPPSGVPPAPAAPGDPYLPPNQQW